MYNSSIMQIVRKLVYNPISTTTENHCKNILIQFGYINFGYRFYKYVEDNVSFCYIRPEMIKDGNEVRGVYTSLIESIKKIFNDKSFSPQREQSKDGSIRYLRDTKLFKSNSFFAKYPSAYTIIMYRYNTYSSFLIYHVTKAIILQV